VVGRVGGGGGGHNKGERVRVERDGVRIWG